MPRWVKPIRTMGEMSPLVLVIDVSIWITGNDTPILIISNSEHLEMLKMRISKPILDSTAFAMPCLWKSCFLAGAYVGRAACACRAWHVDAAAELALYARAAVNIQRAMRRCLAVMRTTWLQHDRFVTMLHDSRQRGSPADIPQELWAAFHTCTSSGGLHPWMTHWALDKLRLHSMPAAESARAIGPGLLGSLYFMRRLSVKQMWCLGV